MSSRAITAANVRLASLQPSVTLTLHALGQLDHLCAHTRYCVDVLPELAARGLPVLQDSWTADTAQIVAAQPSVVVASVPYRMESLAAILKSSLPVLALAPRTLADVFNDIRLLASLTNAGGAGETLIAGMEHILSAARQRTASRARPRVYCEEWGKPLIHSQDWVAELVEAAGGEFLGVPGAHTNAEAISAANPDVLVFAWCGAGDRVPLARVVQQRGWSGLRAVQERRVFCIPDEWLNTPAHTLMHGLACLAAALHPEEFPRPERLVQLAG